MLTLLLAAALAAPPSVPVEGFVGRRFDAAGRFVGYELSRRVDVYSEPVRVALVPTSDWQDKFLARCTDGRYTRNGVRVVGHWLRRAHARPTLVIESVEPADFSEFP